jgi:hypothetical protein
MACFGLLRVDCGLVCVSLIDDETSLKNPKVYKDSPGRASLTHTKYNIPGLEIASFLPEPA